MRIITTEIRDLAWEIDSAKTCDTALTLKIRRLVALLKASCARPEVVDSMRQYETAPAVLTHYPIDDDGFAKSFDPITEEEAFFEAWRQHGIVVGKALVWTDDRAYAVQRIHAMVRDLSNGLCDLDRRETWGKIPTDEAGVSLTSRGFFEVTHDDSIAQLRQSVRMYLHNVLIWRRADLWSTFDRLGVKLPFTHQDTSKGLPLHVDQNPNVHANFRTVQGVLALVDCPDDRGTFVCVPGSRGLFPNYASMAKNDGAYVELDYSNPLAAEFKDSWQVIPLRGGDAVSWDSRTTHANTANRSLDTRYVAYISSGVACEDNAEAVAARKLCFESGEGLNRRDAYMHASKPPRFKDIVALLRVRKAERLNHLGKLLYGIYDDARYSRL